MRFKLRPQHYFQKARLPLVLLSPASLLALGWYGVVSESRWLENSTIQVHQQAQAAVLQSFARSLALQLEDLPGRAGDKLEFKGIADKVMPLGALGLGEAWLYQPKQVLFDPSKTVSGAGLDGSMADLFAVQQARGAFHYEAVTQSVMAGQAGAGWYVWEPERAAESAPWWEFLTQDSGREIAAWTPISLGTGTEAEQTVVLGLSMPLPELMRANGAYAQIQGRVLTMLALTGLVANMVWLLWRNEGRRRGRDQEVYRLAYADVLTGLANRRQMYAVGDGILSDPDRCEDLALIYLDLNGFKDVNDTLGHDLGDALLVEVGRRLRDCLRQQDWVARLGGDEFAILLHPRSLEDAETVAQRMLKRLRQPFYLKGKSIFIGASLGIAPVKAAVRGLNFSQLLTQADIAMYQAKQQGDGSVVVFGEEMQRAAIARVHLEMDLRQAIANEELLLHYQPIFALQNGETGATPHAFEALVRWQHPRRGLLLPQDFLPEAENIGLLVDIDRWVMAQACKALGKWQTELSADRPLGVHVNLSRHSLAQPDLVAFVSRVLRQFKLHAHWLTLEILEETIIDEAPILEENLHALRALGVRLSLDDFGTGYSSLSYLHRLPIHGIKIDRSFVRHMQDSREHKEIIRSIVTLAQSLGLETVAEGIEIRQQLEQLQGLSCDYVQGLLLSHGVEETAARQMLALEEKTSA